MLRLLTDENLNQRIVRGLRQRLPEVDCFTVQDAGSFAFPDEWLLELAAFEGRVIVTHDANTMIGHAIARVSQSLVMPGLIVIPATLEIGRAINELEVITACATESDLKDRIYYLPL
jgi:hypothetical protein